MTAKPISLSKARKDRARAAARRQADANSVKFGRSKAERAADEAQADQAARRLDSHRKDDPA